MTDQIHTLFIQSLLQFFNKVDESVEEQRDDVILTFSLFLNELTDIFSFGTRWAVYIKEKNKDIFNNLHIFLACYKHSIQKRIGELNLLLDNTPFEQLKTEIISFFWAGISWSFQIFLCLYTFYVSSISKKAFEVSKSIFMRSLGYTSNPLNVLDELTEEYKLPIYNSFRYQTIEKYMQWEMSFKISLERFVSECRTSTVTVNDVIPHMENLIIFRFSFLSGREFTSFCFEDFPIEHSIRSEVMFINSLKTVQTNSKIAEPLCIACFNSLKQSASSFKNVQTEDRFFSTITELWKKNKTLSQLLSFFTGTYDGVKENNESLELAKLFENYQKVYTEINEAKKLNDKNRVKTKTMEFEHLLKIVPVVNHPVRRLEITHLEMSTALDKIYLSVLYQSEQKKSRVLLFSVSFYFMHFCKLVDTYFVKCEEMKHIDSLINELLHSYGHMQTNLTMMSKKELSIKILTLKYLCDITFFKMRYINHFSYNFTRSFGGICALYDLSNKIQNTLFNSTNNDISIYVLSKMFRNIFRCIFEIFEELPKQNLLKLILKDAPITSLLQNAMKYDEGNKTLRSVIITDIHRLQSSLFLMFSHVAETRSMFFVETQNYFGRLSTSLLQWYFEPTSKKRDYTLLVLVIIQYIIRAEVIKKPRSSNSYFFCKLLADIDQCCEIFKINKPSNDQFQTVFIKSMNLSKDFFKATSMISQTLKQPKLSYSLVKAFAFIDISVLLKQLIIKLQKGDDVIESVQHINGVIKGYSHFLVSVLTYGVLENEYPEILDPFNDFIELIQTNKINEAIELGNYILFVLFYRISIEEMFFELILFSKNKKNSNDDVEYVLDYFVDYFLLQEHLYPSLSSSVFNSSHFIADTLKKSFHTKNSTSITNVINLLSINIPFTSLAIKLVAIFKKYQQIINVDPSRAQELTVWVELTLEITNIYSSQKTSYDALLHMSYTIMTDFYYHPHGSLCLTDPLSNVIQVLECLIKKDQFIIPQTLMKLLGVFVSCKRIEKVTDNVTNILRIKFLVKTHLKQILFMFDNISWDDSKISTLRTSIIKLEDNISELSTNYDFGVWILKFWEFFVDFVSVSSSVTRYILVLQNLVLILFCVFNSKMIWINIFFMIYNFMFLTEKMQDLIFIGKEVYQYANDFSQIGNKTIMKIGKMGRFTGTFKQIKEQLKVVFEKFKPDNLDDIVALFTQENITQTQKDFVLDKHQNEKSFEDSQNDDCNDLSISEDDESNNEIVEDINKHLHNIFMLLQSVEIDKKSRPKAKIIRLLTSVAEDFFNTADGLNDKIIIKDVQLKSEKLLMDAVCVKNLLNNLVELVTTIRSVICSDKEKWLGILDFIELYDNYQQMISKIISTMYLFLESFKKLNVKRSNETKQILNQMVSGLIYFFITPFIDIEIHDSTYVNSFIYNQSRKEHILENSHVALLCSEFNSISKKEWNIK
ncbi:Separase [Entamoeba marina]